jgi:hypothetical protein
MGRRIWLTLALATLLTASSVASLAGASPRHASDSRSKRVTRSLDFLHSRQLTSGGSGTTANTAWGILGAVASGERMGSSLWTIAGKNPYSYLQANNHLAAAASDANAPVYYSRAIMSYVAVGHVNEVFRAGTPAVDLLANLYSYQDFVDGSATKGRFSALASIPTRQAVDSTAWAILAMQAVGARDQVRFGPAVIWLAGQQNSTDGGFPADQQPASSNVEDTALAIQALEAGVAAGVSVPPSAVQGALGYLRDHQRSDAGFPYAPGGATDCTATAAAIQAIIAAGGQQGDWKQGTHTPADALAALQLKNGGYRDTAADSSATVPVTSWTLVALRSAPFTTYPKDPGSAVKGFICRPKLKSAEPNNKAKFTGTRTVLIHAKYTDTTDHGVGTGVDPKACRVYVDNVNRTRHARIGRNSLSLQLKNVPDGAHTYKLHIVDYAGNVRELIRTFTVAIPVPPAPAPTPAPLPTYHAPTAYPTPNHTPTPSTTLYPTPSATSSYSPYPSASASPGTISGQPVSSPSPSGSPGVGASGGGGSAAGFVGGTLLAMLPIGAAVSYLAFHRREQALEPAGEGRVLPGGGSPWDRVKRSLGKLTDIVKPAGRQ